jgi:hypothetical protein
MQQQLQGSWNAWCRTLAKPQSASYQTCEAAGWLSTRDASAVETSCALVYTGLCIAGLCSAIWMCLCVWHTPGYCAGAVSPVHVCVCVAEQLERVVQDTRDATERFISDL